MLGRFGATVGKMACGLRVVTGDGRRVSYKRALGRGAVEMAASFLPFGLGLIIYIIAAFDKEKRGLHDLICNTRVIYRK